MVALCIPSLVVGSVYIHVPPQCRGEDTSLVSMLGTAWDKENILRPQKLEMWENYVLLPSRFL